MTISQNPISITQGYSLSRYAMEHYADLVKSKGLGNVVKALHQYNVEHEASGVHEKNINLIYAKRDIYLPEPDVLAKKLKAEAVFTAQGPKLKEPDLEHIRKAKRKGQGISRVQKTVLKGDARQDVQSTQSSRLHRSEIVADVSEIELPPESKELKDGLEKILADLGLLEDIRGRELGVTLVDVSTGVPQAMASFNGDEHMYAASLPKIALLLTAHDRGLVTDDNRHVFENMIRLSHQNHWARDALAIIGSGDPDARSLGWNIPFHDKGLRKVNETLDKYGLLNDGRGLQLLKPYGKGYRRITPRTRTAGAQSHGASTNAVARFYLLLHQGLLPGLLFSSKCRIRPRNPVLVRTFVRTRLLGGH
ncbi:hypothetical protein ACFL6C_13510 [Myxococcota bacterium]